jgi:hypothetical protein
MLSCCGLMWVNGQTGFVTSGFVAFKPSDEIPTRFWEAGVRFDSQRRNQIVGEAVGQRGEYTMRINGTS